MENKKVFICPVEGCGKMFRILSKYKTHQMRHTGERPFKVGIDCFLRKLVNNQNQLFTSVIPV